jgi:oleate hydratase
VMRPFGLSLSQYVEASRETAFTIESSVRSAWEALYVLLKRGLAPPPVYQSQYDPKALFNALKVFAVIRATAG